MVFAEKYFIGARRSTLQRSYPSPNDPASFSSAHQQSWSNPATPTRFSPVPVENEASSVGAVCGNDSSYINITDFSVTDGINSEHEQEQRSKDAGPTGRCGQQAPRASGAIQANTNEVEALRLVNQRLIEELEQLTRQMQHPRETRQTQEGYNIPPCEGRHDHSIPRGTEAEAESSQARGHGSPLAPLEEENEAVHGGHIENEDPPYAPPRAEGQTWEQRFRNLQQELSRVKEVVKGRALDTMDTLVQQTESPFTAEVLRYPLPAKFRMPQVEAFDGAKDPVDHLNTYKNQMELHGYQDPVRCRAFAITLKSPAMAWFNRIPPSTISSFRELSIAFVSHFIGARTYRKPSYHLLTIKQGSQESLKSYVQRFNAESLKIDVPDEKFAITAFIAGLGVQSKDLMFSISKNPQASMAEVLAKAEKYINGEEALLLKRESSSTRKEKGATDRRRGRSPKRQGDQRKSPGTEWSDLLKGEGISEIVWAHRKPKDDDITRLNASLH